MSKTTRHDPRDNEDAVEPVSHFNPHNNVTANGVLITEGLVVYDNDYRVGTVVSDEYANEYRCCLGKHGDRGDEATPGQFQPPFQSGWFTEHNVARERYGCHRFCNHDHWFRLSNGAFVNGERMSTHLYGKPAQ